MQPIPKCSSVRFASITRWDAGYNLANQKYGKMATELLKRIPSRIGLLKMAKTIPWDVEAQEKLAVGHLKKNAAEFLKRASNYDLALYLVLASDGIPKIAEQAEALVKRAARVKLRGAKLIETMNTIGTP